MTGIVRTCGCSSSGFGMTRSRTPFLYTAFTVSGSISQATLKDRSKVPHDRSIRLLPLSSDVDSNFFSPLMVKRSPSVVTSKSSSSRPGSSALKRNSSSDSSTFTAGIKEELPVAISWRAVKGRSSKNRSRSHNGPNRLGAVRCAARRIPQTGAFRPAWSQRTSARC